MRSGFRPAAVCLVALCLLVGAPVRAGPISLDGPLVQGSLIVGQAAPGSEVRLDGIALRVSPDGDFVFALGRDAASAAVLEIRGPDGAVERRQLEVAGREWDIQRIDGLPPASVSPSEEDLVRIRQDQALINAVRALDTARPGFRDGFGWPVTGIVSGIFGSQRVLNGEARRPHSGVDIAAAEGTPVLATAPGTVALVHPDMFFTGMSVMIDHGHGVSSVYIHMSEILVAEGQPVERGQPIGAVGMTGRATGPHLHWGVHVGGVAVDGMLLTGPMPAPPVDEAGEDGAGD